MKTDLRYISGVDFKFHSYKSQKLACIAGCSASHLVSSVHFLASEQAIPGKRLCCDHSQHLPALPDL